MSDALTLKLFFLFVTRFLLTQNIHHFNKFLRETVTLDLITFFGIVADIRKELMWSKILHFAIVAGIE